MRWSSRLLLLLSLSACAGEPRRDARPATDLPTSFQHPAPRPRALVSSCPPAAPSAVPLSFDPRLVAGTIAGVTWLVGISADGPALAHLGPTGEIALTKVPLAHADAAAVDGESIWLYELSQKGVGPARWTVVDVRDPDAPVFHPPVAVPSNVTLDAPVALAVGTGRALLVTGTLAARELVLLDTAKHAPVRPPVVMDNGFLPTHAFCGGAHCAVVGVANEGGGPERRLVVVRFAPDGTTEREQLAPGWISAVRAAESPQRVIFLWSDEGGTRLRALDLRGHPVGPATIVPPNTSTKIRGEPRLIPTEGAPLFASLQHDRWAVAPIAPDATLGAFREVPGAALPFFTGALLDDGLAWASLGGDVRYRQVGPSYIHTWTSRVVSGFVSTSSTEDHSASELSAGFGDGRAGFEVFVLTRPGRAATLVVPRGDATLSPSGKSRAHTLRVPCKAR
ncbi:Hypothetical protein A7982_04458 [Minicystis rosea]|nr:Hypothetical protein A7982_04458 [Minicystis rosea]